MFVVPALGKSNEYGQRMAKINGSRKYGELVLK
jgi:hypothetical protein